MSTTISSKSSNPIGVCKWYRLKGQVVYCIRYDVNLKSKPERIRLQGIRPQDYAAYVVQHYIGERDEPFRTVAQIEGIPYLTRLI